MRARLLLLGVLASCGGGERERGPGPGLRDVMVHSEKEDANHSPMVRGRRPVFLSGMIGVDAAGALVDGGIGPETTQALSRIDQTLRAGGLSLDDVVKCTVFLADIADYEAMNQAYRPVWSGPPPARTTVQAQPPMGAAVEIECVASAR